MAVAAVIDIDYWPYTSNNSDDLREVELLREAIPKTNLLLFRIFPKGGGGHV